MSMATSSGGSIDPPFIEAARPAPTTSPTASSGGSIDPPFIEAAGSPRGTGRRGSLADQLIRPSLKRERVDGAAVGVVVWRIN